MHEAPSPDARSLRRHHADRLRRALAGHWSGQNTPRQLGMLLSTRKLCRCCGSPRPRHRRWQAELPGGMTRQEARQHAAGDVE